MLVLTAISLGLAFIGYTPVEAKAKATKCAPGFYSHSSQAGCFPCGAHALTCTSKTGALTCKTGYIVKKGLCVSKPKATKPAPKPTKDTCPAGQYYHSQSQGCYNCGAHAITCHSKGLAIACEKGYTVQDGYCLPPVANTVKVTGAAKTVTVTGGFAQRVTSIVTATSVAAPVTVTARTATTTIESGAQVTATSTDIATLTASETMTSTVSTTTITNWYTPSTTSTTTTSYTTSTAAPVSSPIAKLARYAGCVEDSHLQSYVLYESAISHDGTFTASTAIAACLEQLSDLSAGDHADYTHCVIYDGTVRAVRFDPQESDIDPADYDDTDFTYVDDSFCSDVCHADSDLQSVWGVEYCGGTQIPPMPPRERKRNIETTRYWSVWEVPKALRDASVSACPPDKKRKRACSA